MDGRYTYHCYYCTNVDNVFGSRSAHQIGSCNYIATQIWYENETNPKKKLGLRNGFPHSLSSIVAGAT
jgi:hypothetical protein